MIYNPCGQMAFISGCLASEGGVKSVAQLFKDVIL